MSDDRSSASSPPGGANPSPMSDKPEFSLGRVILTVLVVAAIVGGGFAALEWQKAKPVKLVAGAGQVLWNDKPVTVGAVMTQHVDDPFQSAIGGLSPEGRFELMTNGVPGIAVGRHKVKVASFGDGMSPPPLVPAQYVDFASTPLFIEVTEDPAKNVFAILLEGTLPERRRRPDPPDDAESAEPATDPSAGDEPAANPSTPDQATPDAPVADPPVENAPAAAAPATDGGDAAPKNAAGDTTDEPSPAE